MFQAASNGSLSSTAPLSFASADPNGMDLIGGGGAATADDSVEETRRGSSGGAPPPRPPPPGGAPKSALDDLNDSIRVAMGSPSRPPPPSSASSQIPSSIVGVAPGAAAQPMMQSFPPQIPPQMYGSPVKFAPGTTGKLGDFRQPCRGFDCMLFLFFFSKWVKLWSIGLKLGAHICARRKLCPYLWPGVTNR